MIELIISHDVELNDNNYIDVEQQMMLNIQMMLMNQMMLIDQPTSINQLSIIILMMLIIPTIMGSINHFFE